MERSAIILEKLREQKIQPVKKKKRELPDILVILFSMMILTAIATYFIQGGEFDREVTESGREVIVNGTYEKIETNRTGILDLFYGVFGGMEEASGIIFLILICGGSIGILSKTGAIDKGINSMIVKTSQSNKEIIAIPILLTLFAIAGATFGMAEEAVVYIPILIPLILRMGYDSIVAVSLPVLGSAIGYAGAFLNPFNLGVAQEVSGLPLFSGMPVRIASWLILLIVGIFYLTRYAKRVKQNPERSFVYEDDKKKRKDLKDHHSNAKMTGRDKIILLILASLLIILPIGISEYGWYLKEISGLFLFMGVVVGLIARMSLNDMAKAFEENCKDIASGAITVGFAFGVVVILQEANIIDTITYGLANFAGQFSSSVGVVMMFIAQTLLNIPVNSGSGQAALSMPIMAPLSDLIGITRQTAVLAFQFGDGFTNAITPTSGGTMAALAIAGISWIRWAKFLWPLMVIYSVLCMVILLIVNIFVWPF
jgi:uncharacterized ion transporter superfamily protein YfcC